MMMINDDNGHNDDDEDESNDEDALISECQCQYTGGAAGAIVIVNIGGFALTQSNGSVPLQVFDYLLRDSSLPVLLNASNVVANSSNKFINMQTSPVTYRSAMD